jgi:hypothetical protein
MHITNACTGYAPFGRSPVRRGVSVGIDMRYRIVILLFILTGCASLKTHDISGEVKKYGIIETIVSGNFYSEPNSLAGYAEDNVKMEIVKETTEIPLRQGIAFGFAWCAKGLPEGDITFIYEYMHPPAKEGPKPGSTIFEEEFVIEKADNSEYCSIDAYSLSERWELIPGQWTISVRYQNKLLAAKTFEVIEDTNNANH